MLHTKPSCAHNRQWIHLLFSAIFLHETRPTYPIMHSRSLCLIRKWVNHPAGSNTFCAPTGSGIVLQKNNGQRQYIWPAWYMISKNKSKNWMYGSCIFEQQTILLLCFRCIFYTTLHGLHTHRNFDLQLLTCLITSEKGFLTHLMPNSPLILSIYAVWPVSMVFPGYWVAGENKSWNFSPGYFSTQKSFRLNEAYLKEVCHSVKNYCKTKDTTNKFTQVN